MKIKNVDKECVQSIRDRIIAFLDSAPSDEVFTTRELMSRVGFVINNTDRLRRRMESYVFVSGRKQLLWGGELAIKNLKRHLGQKQIK